MSETEEPPAKLAKIDDEEETMLSDTTASNLMEGSIIPEVLDLPETTLPEATKLPETDLPGAVDLPETDLPGAADLPETIDLPETTDMPEVADLSASRESPEIAEGDGISLEGAEMVEERLQDSMESQGPGAADSQEEWLSEGGLTDDDFIPAVEAAQDSQTSQPEAPQTPEPSLQLSEQTNIPQAMEARAPEQNIEDALNTLEGGPEKNLELPDLDAFLIKKNDVNSELSKDKNGNKKQEADDGNDTDDLLRMLGDDSRTKKLTKTVKDVRKALKERASSDDDDDHLVFKGASAKKLKLSKSVTKKEQEDTEDSDPTSDDEDAMRKMFNSKPKSSKPEKQTLYSAPAKSIVNVIERPRKDRLATSTPLAARSLLKARDVVQVKREPGHYTYSRKPQNAKAPPKPTVLKSVRETPKVEPEDILEEFLDEDFPQAEEEFESEYEEEMGKAGRGKGEMEEDAPSDAGSHSEDGSLYDELPSSDSEDADDWFKLDIRAEKAGDYLPLLGARAKEMLVEEKKRVSVRLATLKHSLAALTDSGKKQAEQVRTATMALAELDDMLKAS